MTENTAKTKLPDVDTTQPDTFETPDAVDETPVANVDAIKEGTNENIDKSGIAAKDAFQKWATPEEEIVLRKKRVQKGGFLQNQTDFELEASGAEETPIQKFHRLQYEVKQFLEEINKQKTEKKDEKTSKQPAINPTQIAEELNVLQSQLATLLKDDKVQPILNPKFELEQAAQLQEGLSKKLLAELNNFAKSEVDTTKTTADPQAKPGYVTYELYFNPGQIKELHAAKVSDLEKRLSQLEQFVGSNKLTIPNASLLEVVEQLNENVALLTPPQIEQTQKIVGSVSKEIDSILDKQKSFQTKQINEKKVSDMFDMMNKWDATNQQLPTIISRLKSLKSLHEEAAAFSHTVHELEAQQEEMKKLLKSDNDLLKQVDENFKKNLETIQKKYEWNGHQICSNNKEDGRT